MKVHYDIPDVLKQELFQYCRQLFLTKSSNFDIEKIVQFFVTIFCGHVTLPRHVETD